MRKLWLVLLVLAGCGRNPEPTAKPLSPEELVKVYHNHIGRVVTLYGQANLQQSSNGLPSGPVTSAHLISGTTEIFCWLRWGGSVVKEGRQFVTIQGIVAIQSTDGKILMEDCVVNDEWQPARSTAAEPASLEEPTDPKEWYRKHRRPGETPKHLRARLPKSPGNP